MKDRQLPPGFRVRPFDLDRDAEAVVDIFNLCSLATAGVEKESLESQTADWKTPGWNPQTDAIVVLAPDGQVAAYSDVWDIDEPHVRKLTFGRVHPNFTGLGIGSYLLCWAEERARQNLHESMEGARVVLFQVIPGEDRVSARLLERQGYSMVRIYNQMEIELEAPPPAAALPDGVTIRPITLGKEERAVLHAAHEAFRDHWGALDEPFEPYYDRWMHYLESDPYTDSSLWFLAEESGAIAGVSLCLTSSLEDPQLGWVQQLGVLRQWRKKGIGLALLQYSFGAYYRRGLRRVGLRVDSDSLTGATRLYEKAGMHLSRQILRYEKELRPGFEPGRQAAE